MYVERDLSSVLPFDRWKLAMILNCAVGAASCSCVKGPIP